MTQCGSWVEKVRSSSAAGQSHAGSHGAAAHERASDVGQMACGAKYETDDDTICEQGNDNAVWFSGGAETVRSSSTYGQPRAGSHSTTRSGIMGADGALANGHCAPKLSATTRSIVYR
eukprot:7388492-Prymnesium_polylepis.1